jgi:Domain of unknown function (DUF3883)
MRKLAAKRLTASDLTFFEWHFRNRPAGNQKAINLNAYVFIDRLYPALPEVSQETGGRLPLDLSIYGPALAGLDNYQRKIVKGDTYKNWRLDGEYIPDKPEDQGRYRGLTPGDIAVFEFFGVPVPSAAKMILLARSTPDDAALVQFFEPMFGVKSMVHLSANHIEQCVRGVSPPEDHPIRELEIEAAIEDAVLSGLQGIQKLRKRRRDQQVTQEEILRARRNMEEVGRLGEELVNRYLGAMLTAEVIQNYVWVSESNAVAPYDFQIEERSGQVVCIDVKATSGEFERPLHISISELLQMRYGDSQYYLYRVYNASPEGARLRISKDLKNFAARVLDGLEHLPDGVQADSVSVLPASLPFGEEIALQAEDEIAM